MLREQLEEALRGHNADFAEIRVEETEATQLSYRDRELDEVGRSVNLGGCVRAAYKGGWGFVSFNALTGLKEKVDLAVRQARLVGQAGNEETQLAPVPTVVDLVPLLLLRSPFDVPLADKKRLMDEYVEMAWSRSSKVQTTNASYADSRRKVTVATSEGSYVEQERARCRVSVQVLAREDGNVQQSRAAFSSGDDYGALIGRHQEVAEATDRAVALLAAQPATGGEYTVVCDPRLAAVFAHEAFGHLSEGDNVYENERLRQVMVLGRRFGREHLNIADGASIPDQPGSFKYDDEGTPTRKSSLIKDGVLVGRLHSRETAGKMGEEPTGNARAQSYRHRPLVRMTNTVIEPGASSFDEMLAETKEGIFCKDWYGGSTTHEQFAFSCAEAWMIRDGKLAEPLRGTTLSGNLFTTLENIDMIGRDFEWTEAGGTCGKGGQYAPVGQGSPYIRILKAVVGGK